MLKYLLSITIGLAIILISFNTLSQVKGIFYQNTAVAQGIVLHKFYDPEARAFCYVAMRQNPDTINALKTKSDRPFTGEMHYGLNDGLVDGTYNLFHAPAISCLKFKKED